MILRPYQQAAIDAVYEHLQTRDDNPCAVIPTAGGKTPVMASICRDAVELWNGRVLVLAHVKELLEQTADKLRTVCPEVPFGIYSAGLKRRDTKAPVIIAGIQSVFKRACELDRFDLVMIDEAHLIPQEGDGMYCQFLAEAKIVNPDLRIIGLTATPFRLKTGSICTPDGFLNHICYEVGVRELIRDGFLCPLVTKAGKTKADVGSLHIRGGEFVAEEVESLMDSDALVEAACAEIVAATADRNACLIFSSGIRHGEHIVRCLREKHGVECGFVSGETPAAERHASLARFKAAKLKYLCNVNVLTTGFDAPHIDCVALVRPTMSPGLYYQMVGRGFRLHSSKQNCLVLDFGGNVLRHGPVDQLRIKATNENEDGVAPAKECPACQALVACGYSRCPQCGFEFPPPERKKHDAKASDAGILSGEVKVETFRVQDVRYSVHLKGGAGEDAPRSMHVDYRIGWNRWKSEWICFEHDGYARQKAEAWWTKRSPDPIPDSAEQAVDTANGGGVAKAKTITVRSVVGDEFDRIVGYDLGEKPEPLEVSPRADPYSSDEVPF